MQGGHNKTHGKYENTYRIDSYAFHKIIKELKEREMSYSWPWEWIRKDEVCASIQVFYDIIDDELQLSYSYNGKAKKDRIKLCYLSNNYGGQRMYFYCPRCGKRIRFLCATQRGFVCRWCGNLNYHVQQSSREDILMDRIEKILRILEVDMTFLNKWERACFSDIEKPRYMRWEKYGRLMLRLLDAQREYREIQNKIISRILR